MCCGGKNKEQQVVEEGNSSVFEFVRPQMRRLLEGSVYLKVGCEKKLNQLQYYYLLYYTNRINVV